MKQTHTPVSAVPSKLKRLSLQGPIGDRLHKVAAEAKDWGGGNTTSGVVRSRLGIVRIKTGLRMV